MRTYQPMTPERAAELARAFRQVVDALRRMAEAVVAAVRRMGALLWEQAWERHPDAQRVCFHDDPATAHVGLTPLDLSGPGRDA